MLLHHWMTGWRIGYAAGPRWLADALQVLQSQSTSNACSISQAAAVAALDGGAGFIDDWLAMLAERRGRVLQTVARIDSLASGTPEGAFYVFANCKELLGRSTPEGRRLEIDLDLANYLRIAYAVDMPVLDAACRTTEHTRASESFMEASLMRRFRPPFPSRAARVPAP
ncbi:aminotransferase class I/II-fold pyridoxal phosphate-dependent enzyme [Variovorax sp. LjRoot130]|uniref:aminotransferase class I/II-fold pyridoxal phosphate-dependent enzyme n=1 Tax=Variovorax sp. LjRoot130 TaxID=3342261 RepID=UPI003ED0E36A